VRVASLGSGSRGNATLVQGDEACVLVDCGFSIRETERRLAVLDMDPGALTAVLVTHEHSDHLGGVLPLARRYRLPVYMTAGTARAAQLRHQDPLHIIGSGERIVIGGLDVEAVAVPHDAREPVQYIFATAGVSFGMLTWVASLPMSSIVIGAARACCWRPITIAACWPPGPIRRGSSGAWAGAGGISAIARRRNSCGVSPVAHCAPWQWDT